jgi:transcriptional regulator with XRE-family HTH domain
MQDQRNHPSATKARNVRTFRGGDYVANLMAELNRVAIAQRIAQARDEKGLTQGELAELMEVALRTIQYWEAKQDPVVAYDRMGELADVLDVTKKWLLHGDPGGATPESPPEALLREVAGAVGDVVDFLPELRRRLQRIEAALGIDEDDQASPGTGTDTP